MRVKIYLLVATLTNSLRSSTYLSLSFSPCSSLTAALQLSADCCAVFFPSADVIIRPVCQTEGGWADKSKTGQNKRIFSAFIVPLNVCLCSAVQQREACKPYSWKTLIKGVNRERNYMWYRLRAKAADAWPTSKQLALTRCGPQMLGKCLKKKWHAKKQFYQNHKHCSRRV